MSAQQYFAFADYKANGWRLQLINGLLSILWAEKNTTQLGRFGLTCDILHSSIALEAQVPWGSCSPGVLPGPVRRKWPWTPECRWSQPTWWLPTKRLKPQAGVSSLCQLPWYFHSTSPEMPAPAELLMAQLACLLPSLWWFHSLVVCMDGRLYHPHPRATTSGWRNAGWVTDDTSGARRGHGFRGREG